MKDWLGNELNIDDLVIYGAASGRSITMVIGRIVEFKENGSVRVQPLNSSRWKQHYGRDYYVDSRTGKRIDPYSSEQHWKSGGHYILKSTGEPVPPAVNPYWHNRVDDVEYVATVFKDHVEKRHEEPKPVTITVTENLTKWTGQYESSGEVEQ